MNRLLATKGYDLLTMDEVAAEVGIAKASLYKHFASKEDLAAAVLTRLMERTLAVMDGFDPAARAIEKLKHVVAWSIEEHLADQMPLLPSTRSSIRQAMSANADYTERLARVTERLGTWIEEAQTEGQLTRELPGEVILFTLYARSCDPVVDFLRASGALTPQEIVQSLVRATFGGLAAP